MPHNCITSYLALTKLYLLCVCVCVWKRNSCCGFTAALLRFYCGFTMALLLLYWIIQRIDLSCSWQDHTTECPACKHRFVARFLLRLLWVMTSRMRRDLDFHIFSQFCFCFCSVSHDLTHAPRLRLDGRVWGIRAGPWMLCAVVDEFSDEAGLRLG